MVWYSYSVMQSLSCMVHLDHGIVHAGDDRGLGAPVHEVLVDEEGSRAHARQDAQQPHDPGGRTGGRAGESPFSCDAEVVTHLVARLSLFLADR